MPTADPLVSVIMPCHEQAAYVRDALRSVLAQDYAPLEIIVLDDASSDGTYDLLKEEIAAYRGPHRVGCGRSTSSLRIEAYNRLVEQARGDFIVHAHGDDISMPGRVRTLVAAWQGSRASLVASNAVMLDGSGRSRGLLFDRGAQPACTLDVIVRQVRCPEMLGATFGYGRELFERFGPLDRSRSVIRTDVILPFRAALLGGCAFVSEPLLLFRQHESVAARLTGRRRPESPADWERIRAESLGQLVYLHETLAAAHGLDDGRREALRLRLLERIAKAAGRWAAVRNRLVGDGWRIDWSRED
jgi:glycosyltransferase involved in cell wall biosynthesis